MRIDLITRTLTYVMHLKFKIIRETHLNAGVTINCKINMNSNKNSQNANKIHLHYKFHLIS